MRVFSPSGVSLPPNVLSFRPGLKDESLTRSALKSAIERRISRDVIVIADSMNYVKGYRYELYCVSRAQATTRVTVR